MPINKIYPTTHFIKAYKGLPEEIKARLRQREEIFKAEPFDPRLKTHKTTISARTASISDNRSP